MLPLNIVTWHTQDFFMTLKLPLTIISCKVLWQHTVYKANPAKQKKIFDSKFETENDQWHDWVPYKFLSSISLICPHDPWWNPSTSDHASWKSYQLLTIAEDKHIETPARQTKLTSSTLSFYLRVLCVAFIGSHFSKSLSASSLISHISIFSLLRCLLLFIVSFLSLSLCEYICSKIASYF